MRNPMHRCCPTASALLAFTLLAGCVTERTGYKPRGVPVDPDASPGDVDLSTAFNPAPAAPISVGRSRFGVAHLGAIRYDGLTLPIVSPAGDFLAAQVTDPPTWAALLGLPGENRADLARLQTFRLTADAVVPVDFTPGLPRGLLLGRSSSPRGVLVEAPQPDGARWIGRLDWSTGQISWLVRENGLVAAHAIELRDGTLIYCRRAVAEVAFALVIRSPGKPEMVVPTSGECAFYPIASPSQRYVGFMSLRYNADKAPSGEFPAIGRGAEWGAMDLVSVDLLATNGPAIAGRFRIADAGTPKQAFQAAAGQDAVPADVPSLPAAPRNASPDQKPPLADPRETFTLVAARWDGVALLGAASGNVARLAPRAIAASLVATPAGPVALVSTDRDLLLIDNPTAAPTRAGSLPPSTRVTTQPLIVRGSPLIQGPQNPQSGGESLVGFGLDTMATEPTLRIMRLQPLSTPPAPPANAPSDRP